MARSQEGTENIGRSAKGAKQAKRTRFALFGSAIVVLWLCTGGLMYVLA